MLVVASMQTKMIAIGAWLVISGASACVTEDVDAQATDDVARPENANVRLRQPAQREIPEDNAPEGCELVVATEGACSLACDPDAALAEFVPAGTCTMFECDLSDGTTIHVGGCHL
ncbi:MAG: hypothetical protein JWP01_183 [Myxococcales bacterium]|nr:hypothetical protein [Myxococcales bacterium]